MFGDTFICLQSYVEKRVGEKKWRSLLIEAGLPPDKNYHTTQSYPDSEFDQLWHLCALELGMEAQELLRLLGKLLGEHIIRTYALLFKKNWRSLDVIEKIAPKVYQSIQMMDPNVPEGNIQCERLTANEVVVHYKSHRKFCSYVIGIAEAMGEHFKEKLVITQTKCMRWDDDECEIHVKLGGLSAKAG